MIYYNEVADIALFKLNDNMPNAKYFVTWDQLAIAEGILKQSSIFAVGYNGEDDTYFKEATTNYLLNLPPAERQALIRMANINGGTSQINFFHYLGLTILTLFDMLAFFIFLFFIFYKFITYMWALKGIWYAVPKRGRIQGPAQLIGFPRMSK